MPGVGVVVVAEVWICVWLVLCLGVLVHAVRFRVHVGMLLIGSFSCVCLRIRMPIAQRHLSYVKGGRSRGVHPSAQPRPQVRRQDLHPPAEHGGCSHRASPDGSTR